MTIQNTATNVVTTTKNESNSLTNKFMGTVGEYTNTAALIQKTGVDPNTLLSDLGADKLVSAYGSTVNKFKSATKAVDDAVGNIQKELESTKQSVAKNLTDQVGSLVNTGTNLTTTPLTFVASTTKNAIDSINLEDADAGFKLSDLSEGTIGKLAELGNDTLGSSASAIKAVTNNLREIKAQATGAVNGILSSVSAEARGIFDPIKSVVDFGKDTLSPNNVAGIIKNNLDFLPNSLQNKITKIAQNSTKNLYDKINKLSNQATGVDNILESIASLESIDTISKRVTDSNGNNIFGLINNGNFDDLVNLVSGANSICGDTGIDPSNLLDFEVNKDLYDLLVGESMNRGSSKILDSLSNCGKYNDSRTTNVVKNKVDMVARNGDVHTLSSAVNAVGSSALYDPEDTLQTLIANMDYDTDKKKTLDELLKTLNIEGFSLVKADSYDGKAISAEKVIALSAKSTGYVDGFLGSTDLRNSVNQAYNKYVVNA